MLNSAGVIQVESKLVSDKNIEYYMKKKKDKRREIMSPKVG